MNARKSNKKIKVGDLVPHFVLPNKDGKTVDIKDKIGEKILVLYFYPADYTGGCTAQACTFRDRYELFLKAGAEVIGISGDSTESHSDFASSYNLPFLLLSDEKDQVRDLFGIGKTFGIIPGRVTYIIDRKGIIRHIFSSQFNPKKHIDEALKVIEKLNKE